MNTQFILIRYPSHQTSEWVNINHIQSIYTDEVKNYIIIDGDEHVISQDSYDRLIECYGDDGKNKGIGELKIPLDLLSNMKLSVSKGIANLGSASDKE